MPFAVPFPKDRSDDLHGSVLGDTLAHAMP
jgi:hypothetical protein